MKKLLALIGILILLTTLYFNKNESELPSKPKFKISKVSEKLHPLAVYDFKNRQIQQKSTNIVKNQ